MVFHILNGDALKEQFPQELKGEVIIFRECLVEGPVNNIDLDDFFNRRSQFICDNYADVTPTAYQKNSAEEIKKTLSIPEDSEINLWFEDDLFCQVNFWFISNLIVENLKSVEVYLVRPPRHTPYGFGGLNQTQLIEAFQNKIPLNDLGEIASLWSAYQNGKLDRLKEIGRSLLPKYPFIQDAIAAHIVRIPSDNEPGRPTRSLMEIMKELNTDQFGPVFQEFCKREAIYGFGDLQVKRLYDKIMEDLDNTQ